MEDLGHWAPTEDPQAVGGPGSWAGLRAGWMRACPAGGFEVEDFMGKWRTENSKRDVAAIKLTLAFSIQPVREVLLEFLATLRNRRLNAKVEKSNRRGRVDSPSCMSN